MRRSWIAPALLVVIVALMTTAFLGCGDGGTGASSGPVSPSALVDKTKPAVGDVDLVTWTIAAEPSSMDIVYNADFDTGQISANVCERLLAPQPDFSVRPVLAESVANPDPLTWVYAIRKGVTFHDGSPLTAEDVAYSLKRNMDPDVGSYWSGAYVNVKSIEVTAPMEVTVRLKRPDYLFNQYMATPAGGIGCRATIERAGKSYGTPQGGVNYTGPFKIEDWAKGQSITLARNEDYWDKEHMPKARRVKFVIISDPAGSISALLAGQVQGSWYVPLQSMARLSASEVGSVYFGRNTVGLQAVVLSLDGALRDVRIRQALSMAIDREGIIKALSQGAAEPNRAPAQPGTWGYAEDVFRPAYDALETTQLNTEEAKRLVQEAGAPSDPITVAVTPSQAEVPLVGLQMQAAGKKIGLNVRLRSLTGEQANAVYVDPKARKGLDILLADWGTDFADPLQMYQYFRSDDFYNMCGYSNPDVDELVHKAARTADSAARAELVVEAQRAIVNDMIWIPIYALHNSLFMNKAITGSPVSDIQLHYPWAADIGSAE